MIDQASTYAAEIDNIIIWVAILAGFWFFVAEGVFFWLILRYRAKPGVKAQYLEGHETHVKKWVTWPHFFILGFDLVIIWMAISVWYNVKQQLPEPDRTIRAIGQQWARTFQHPGQDNQLDTDDDIFTVDELHVEVDQTYHFLLEARDVLHAFSIPVFRIKQDAIPGRTITGWFEATQTGEYDVQCAEICGIGHGAMAARVHIEDSDGHAAWVASAATAQ